MNAKNTLADVAGNAAAFGITYGMKVSGDEYGHYDVGSDTITLSTALLGGGRERPKSMTHATALKMKAAWIIGKLFHIVMGLIECK